MRHNKWANTRAAVATVIKQQRYTEALRVFEAAMPEYEDREGWNEALALFEGIPAEHRLQSLEAALLYAKALRICGHLEPLVQLSQQLSNLHKEGAAANVQLEAAGALNGLHRFRECQTLLQGVIPHLRGPNLGVAWARLGLALFYLGEPIEVWRKAFAAAHPLLSGEELGRALLNEGHCLAESQLREESRYVNVQALACFKGNPYFLAWIRHNLGTAAIRDLEPEAEQHFLKAVELTRNPKAARLRAAALIGLGASRRLLGEWARAESAYREALRFAADAHDHEEAYLGLSRTLRLGGRLPDALEVLEEALNDSRFEHHMIQVARATTFLAQQHPHHARAALAYVGTLSSESNRWLFRLAKAELARQEKKLDEAVTLLKDLPLGSFHAREEVPQFPLLFDLLRAAGQDIPQPLEYIQGITVLVQAQGVLQVSVNGRIVEIQPTSRVGELLVFLLEQGGSATLEAIETALYSNLPHAKRRRQAIWNLTEKLRKALGWENSVLALRTAYKLDPQAKWHYDIAEARAQGEFGGEFLSGIYSEWAREIEQELQGLNPPRSRRALN